MVPKVFETLKFDCTIILDAPMFSNFTVAIYRLFRADNDIKTIAALSEFYERDTNISLLRSQIVSRKTKVWLFLDEPKSSKYAMVGLGDHTYLVCYAIYIFSTFYVLHFFSHHSSAIVSKTSYCSYARPAQPGPIRWLDPVQSDSVITLVSVLFGKCTTLVVTKS